MNQIYFDIETGPLPESELTSLMPAFDPGDVKIGNLKDPEKIAEKIRQAEEDHRRSFLEQAALDARYGRVMAIGMEHNGQFMKWLDEDYSEPEMLHQFWEIWRRNNSTCQFIGFNIHQFDLPFMMRRSWKLSVPLPVSIRRGRFWNDDIIDLREIWQLGDRYAQGSLETIAKHLGVGEKNGNGKDFARLLTEDRNTAIDYLQNEIRLLKEVAGKLL